MYNIKELHLTELKEDAGTADYLDLLLKKQQVIISEKQLVSDKINEVIAMINLYQAFGSVDFIKQKSL